jgi:hypothetical protein
MPGWLNFAWPNGWADFLQVVGVPLAVLAVIFGGLQLRKAGRTARVQILLALDESLSDFEDIRAKVNRNLKVNRNKPITTREDKIRLRRYIGTFERVGHALKVKEIKLKTVDQFYGSRFRNLIEYLFASSYARSIVKNCEGWDDFYYLWGRFLGYYSLWDKLLRRKKNRRELKAISCIAPFLKYDARITERNNLSRKEWAKIFDAFWKATASVQHPSLNPIGKPDYWFQILENRLPCMIKVGIPTDDPDQYKKLLAEITQNRP